MYGGFALLPHSLLDGTDHDCERDTHDIKR